MTHYTFPTTLEILEKMQLHLRELNQLQDLRLITMNDGNCVNYANLFHLTLKCYFQARQMLDRAGERITRRLRRQSIKEAE